MKEYNSYTIGIYPLKSGGYEFDLASIEDGEVVATTTIAKIKSYYKSEGFEFVERTNIEGKDTLVFKKQHDTFSEYLGEVLEEKATYKRVILKILSVNHKGDIRISFDGEHGFILRHSDIKDWFNPSFGLHYHEERIIERGTILEIDCVDESNYIINPRIVGYKAMEG